VPTLYYPLKTSLYCVQFSFGNPCFFSALVQVRVTCVSLAKFASHLILVVVIVTPYAISLCHALIFPSFLPYLYDRTALLQSTGLTSAVAAISILSSLFP
jgi:hypothetical protein